MNQPAGYALSAMRTDAGAQGRKVMGKGLVAVSALGMVIVLVALVQAAYLLAGSMFLLTVGILAIMFQRAVSLFHGPAAPALAPGHAIGHAAPGHAAAGN
jgi:hypothetical protein